MKSFKCDSCKHREYAEEISDIVCSQGHWCGSGDDQDFPPGVDESCWDDCDDYARD